MVSYSRTFLRELKYRNDIAEGKDYAQLIQKTVEEITESVLHTAKSGITPWFCYKVVPALNFHSKVRQHQAVENVMAQLRVIFPDCTVRYEDNVLGPYIHVEWM
jgi:hypothetical protein